MVKAAVSPLDYNELCKIKLTNCRVFSCHPRWSGGIFEDSTGKKVVGEGTVEALPLLAEAGLNTLWPHVKDKSLTECWSILDHLLRWIFYQKGNDEKEGPF